MEKCDQDCDMKDQTYSPTRGLIMPVDVFDKQSAHSHRCILRIMKHIPDFLPPSPESSSLAH